MFMANEPLKHSCPAPLPRPCNVAEMFMANEPLKHSTADHPTQRLRVAEMFMANEPLKPSRQPRRRTRDKRCRDVYGE